MKIFLSILILLLSITIQGQQRGIEMGVLPGYHFASNKIEKTQQSMDGLVSGFEVSWVQNGFRNGHDSAIYGRPRIAITGRYIQMNKPDTFGSCLGIFPSYTFPVFSTQNKKSQLGMRIGYGININTIVYDSISNFDNRAISLPLNFALDAGIRWNQQIGKQIMLNLGMGLYHISNGSLKMFNGGINIGYAQAGLTWNWQPISNGWNLIPAPHKDWNPTWEYSIYGAVSHRELGYFKNLTRFWVFTLHQELLRKYTPIFSIGPGLDFFYDATQMLLRKDILRIHDVNELDKLFLAAGLTSKFNVRRLFLPVGIYHYLAPLKNVQEPVYIRFGLGHKFSHNYFAGLFFKGTINDKLQLQSDFMEFSFGFSR